MVAAICMAHTNFTVETGVDKEEAAKEQQAVIFKAYHELMDTEKRSFFCPEETDVYLLVLSLYLASSVTNYILKVLVVLNPKLSFQNPPNRDRMSPIVTA